MVPENSWFRSVTGLPVFLLLAGMAACMAYWPIIAYDHDLFYHLAGGRYIFEHLRLPDTPYFSYLTSPETWVNYYWLHQVFLYGLFKLGGYEILAVGRAVLFGATAWVVYRYLKAQAGEGTGALGLLVLALTAAYAGAVLPRDLLLRPHVYSYLAIVLFQFIINRHPRAAWWLPVAAVFWMNLHGVEYPVMLLLCGAYLAEYFVPKLIKRPVPEQAKQLRWPLILCMYAVLATPAGTGLLLKPFSAPLFHELVIGELKATRLNELVVFSLYPVSNVMVSLSNLLIVFLTIGSAFLLTMRKLRLSRVILLVGGLLLLPQSRRFTYEYVLLLLPVAGDLLAYVSRKRSDISWKFTLPAGLALSVAMLLVTVSYMGPRPKYPLANTNIPVGVCEFLQKEGPGGRILNEPNSGGYLVWKLHPKYSLFMDMETMLFSSFDFFLSHNFSQDKTLLKYLVDRYSPAFIMTTVQETGSKETFESQKHFIPVFIDEYAVLFADSRQNPALVEKYALRHLALNGNISADYQAMTPEQRAGALAESLRMLAVHPTGLTTNAVAAKVSMADGKPDQAMTYADTIIENHPESFLGYTLKAQAAFELGDYPTSVALNRKALDFADPAEAPSVRKNLYAAYVRLENYPKAYETLKEAVNPMSIVTPAKDLYDLGLVAASSGRGKEGLLLLDMALAKSPPENAEFIAKARELRDKLAKAIGR